MDDKIFGLFILGFVFICLIQYIYITEREFERRKKQRENERQKNEARDRSKKA